MPYCHILIFKDIKPPYSQLSFNRGDTSSKDRFGYKARQCLPSHVPLIVTTRKINYIVMTYHLTVLSTEYVVLYLASSQTLYVSSVMVEDPRRSPRTIHICQNHVPSAISWRCDVSIRQLGGRPVSLAGDIEVCQPPQL